jgi:hypothetical protein
MSIARQSSNESTMASSGEASELFSSDLLVEVAPLASKEILVCASKKKPLPSVLGSRIGTALHLIARHLEVMQPFQLPATAQDLSRQALQDFLKICKVRSIPTQPAT